jgi:hypothetical protein
MWCIQEIDEEYRSRMYNILDLYGEEFNPLMPVICIDEKPKQLIKDSRKHIAMMPGKIEKVDYEYIRNGKANIFIAVEPRGGQRIAQVTKQRCKKDFALFIKTVIENYPDAKLIRIVLDNLNTHKEKSIIEAFGNVEAMKLIERIEFHYTPKHASWLNAAEIEIGVMDTQCTARRIGDINKLDWAVHSWAEMRNNEQRKINWKFTKEDADRKLGKHYVI